MYFLDFHESTADTTISSGTNYRIQYPSSELCRPLQFQNRTIIRYLPYFLWVATTRLLKTLSDDI